MNKDAVAEMSQPYQAETAQRLVPEGYKQTKVGMIPEDWSTKKVGEVADVIRGASPRPKGDKRYYGGSVPRLMVEDVTRDGKYVTPSVDSLTEEGAKLSRPCSKGTLTLVCSGTVGVPSILAVDACIHDGFLGLVRVSKKTSIDYLYHFFTTQQEKFNNSATHGGVFTNLTTDGVKEFLIAFPSTYKEQTVIANALSDTDALLSELEKLITKKQAIKTATMQQLLTGRTRLPQFAHHPDGSKKGYKQSELGEMPEDWGVFGLNQNFTIYAGGDVPKDSFSAIKSDDCPYPIFANAIKNKGLYGYTGCKRSKPDSITITARGFIGHAEYREEYFFPIVRLLVLEPTGFLNAQYTTYAINERIEFPVESTGVPQLTAPQVGKYAVAAPEDINEQTAIVTILSDMDEELQALEQQLSKTRQLKQGMMQQLLTGKTRLPVEHSA